MHTLFRITGAVWLCCTILVMCGQLIGEWLNPIPALTAGWTTTGKQIIYRVDIERGIYFPINYLPLNKLPSPDNTASVQPVSHGEQLELYITPHNADEYHLGTYPIFTLPNRVAWAQDSQSLYVISMRRKDTPFYLYQVNVRTGDYKQIGAYHIRFTPTDIQTSIGGKHVQLCEGIGNFRQCALVDLTHPDAYVTISQRHHAIASDDGMRAEISIIASEFLWEFEEFRLHDVLNQTSQIFSLHEMPAMPKAPLYWSHDGQLLAMAATGSGFVLYDRTTDTFRLIEGDFHLLTGWSSDGRLLLVMQNTFALATWDNDTETLTPITTSIPLKHDADDYRFIWSEDSRYLLAISDNLVRGQREVSIFDMQRNHLIATLLIAHPQMFFEW